MRSLILALCFAAVASPVYGLDVYENFTINPGEASTDPTEWIDVYGDATLTISGPGGDEIEPRIVNKIRLHDSASLTLDGGSLLQSIYLLGDGHKVDFVSGRFRQRLHGNGSGEINLYPEVIFGGTFEFPAGSQLINAYGFTGNANHTGATVVNSPGTSVRAYAKSPSYGIAAEGGHLNGFAGTLYDGYGEAPFRVPGFDVDPDFDWLLYPLDDRPAGDTNGDFVVDLADLNNVRNHFGSRDYRGDTFPMDGIVDLNDLNLVRNSFGDSVAVPEPSGWVIGLILFSCAFGLTAGLLSDPRKLL